MITQVKAELLKVRSTRTTLGLVVGMILLTLLIVLLSGLLTHADGLSSKKDQLSLFATGGVALIFSGLAGVLLITSEYRYGTIHPTFLFTPRRSRVLSAKLTVGLLTGLVFGAAGVGLALGLGSLIISARGIPSALGGGDTTLLSLGGLAGIALRGAFSVGLGAIVRNQVAAVIGLLAWDFIVNGLLFGLASSVGRFMPTTAADALMGLKTDHLLARRRRGCAARVDADAGAGRTRTDAATRRDVDARPTRGRATARVSSGRPRTRARTKAGTTEPAEPTLLIARRRRPIRPGDTLAMDEKQPSG